jgi:uncharacterized protein YndB with AHSA1/START domain
MKDQEQVEITIQPIQKQIKVPLPVDAAFRLFTDGINQWWPLATHSVGKDQAETCFFEGWVGGGIFEVIKDGRQVEWGRVLDWQPYHLLRFQWYPGRTPDTAQQVTVTFQEVQGGTLVVLIHSGWESLGEKAISTRKGYESGWDYVLGKYSTASTLSMV